MFLPHYRTVGKYLLHELLVMHDTSAAEADFFISFTAGINACSTP